MGVVYYGTKTYSKFKGYYGEKEECEHCHRVYEKAFVKNTSWFYIDFIPLFPIRKRFLKICPICGDGVELKSKDAREEMRVQGSGTQNIKLYAKHIFANKPKKFTEADTSYELWAKDMNTNEEFCVLSNTDKGICKGENKRRGLKKLEIIDIK